MEHWRDNPHRSPDWRWQRANEILRPGSLPLSGTIDGGANVPVIRKASRFVREYDEASTEHQRWRVMRKYYDLFWAFNIHHEDAIIRRSALEARLLANEKDEHIAVLMGVSTKAVQLYGQLFFDVRSRLPHRDWVVHSIIGEQVHYGLTGRDYPILWKLFGYFGGPYVLDAIMSPLATSSPAKAADEVNAFLLDVAQNGIKRKAAQIASVAPVDAKTYELLLSNFVKFIEIERTTNSTGSHQEQLLVNLSAMLEELPFSVGGAAVSERQVLGAARISYYDDRGIELRSQDLLTAGADQHIVHPERYEGASFSREG